MNNKARCNDITGRELFGKRSLDASTNEYDALDAVHSVEGSTSISSSYTTPSEQQQRLFEFVPSMADDAHGVGINLEVNRERMPPVEFLKLLAATSGPKIVLQNRAGLGMRHRRGRSRELFG